MEVMIKFDDMELPDEQKKLALAAGIVALLRRLGVRAKDATVTHDASTPRNEIRVSTEKEFPNSIFKQMIIGPLLQKMVDDADCHDHTGGAAAP